MNFSICFWLLCLVVSSALCAEASADKTRELADVHSKVRQVGADVKKLAAERSAQLEQLRGLEKQFGETINALDAIKVEIRRQELALQNVRNKITATQKDVQTQLRGLEGLVKSAHAMGNREGLDVLLNQQDPALSGRMLVYYDYISKARTQKMQAIEEDFKTLRQLESQKNTETQLLQMDLDKKQQETDALHKLKQQRENLVAQLSREFSAKQHLLVSLIHDEKKLERLVASLQKTDDNEPQPHPPEPVVEKKSAISVPRPQQKMPSSPNKPENHQSPVQSGKAFAELQGQLPWPVQGAIVERFGSRRFETKWDGTVIGASEGAEIHAVAAGRVVYADWLRGYGLMLIVDHGKGYMSLYAFNQNLRKGVGDYVRSGEALASVGRSGGRSSAALYFGIRQKGRAVDPEKWCRKPGKG